MSVRTIKTFDRNDTKRNLIKKKHFKGEKRKRMQSEGKFRSMAPELYSASVSLTFAFGVGCGG